MTRFLVYDVFTDAAFGGNQLAILPEAGDLPEAALQKIAREFNFSETTFVYPPRDPGHTARVRIFTPTTEVPFAGHPTIGTAIALSDEGAGSDLVLELGVGPIPAQVSGSTARFRSAVPLERIAEPEPETVAAALGIAADRIVGQPVQATIGLPFVFAELVDRAALSACQPVTDGFRAGAAAYPAGLDFAIMAYVREGADQIHARMFAPLDNIPEDPATGSAAATLALLLAPDGGRFTLHQGVDMGRPSVIELETDSTGVSVAGQAVRVMEGRLTL